jgi:hypothetical protein
MSLSASTPLTKEATGLLGLPLVIVRTIFEEACGIHLVNSSALTGFSQIYHDDIESFMSLRLVSKVCRRESERLLFRTLSISLKNVVATKGDIRILTRLQDPQDIVVEHIRHLCIGPFTDFDYYNTTIAPTVERVLARLTQLQSLSWNLHLPIPLSALQNINELHPLAQLHVKNRARRFPIPLPQSLLSYPQLHTLDVSVYYVGRISGPTYSELQILKNCLIYGGSVKILRLTTTSSLQGVPAGFNTDDDPGHSLHNWEGVEEGPVNFHWQDHDCFPPLEELKLGYNQYDLSLEQCQMWIKCMDWSKMRKLDLGKGAPEHLFKTLAGEVPHLESLTFGIWPYYGLDQSSWDCRDMTIIARFAESIISLKELSVEVFDYNDFVGVMTIVARSLGHSLLRLHVYCVGWNSVKWTEEQFVNLLADFPNLIDLDMELRWQNVKGCWRALGAVTAQGKYESMTIFEKYMPSDRGDIRGM